MANATTWTASRNYRAVIAGIEGAVMVAARVENEEIVDASAEEVGKFNQYIFLTGFCRDTKTVMTSELVVRSNNRQQDAVQRKVQAEVDRDREEARKHRELGMDATPTNWEDVRVVLAPSLAVARKIIGR